MRTTPDNWTNMIEMVTHSVLDIVENRLCGSPLNHPGGEKRVIHHGGATYLCKMQFGRDSCERQLTITIEELSMYGNRTQAAKDPEG